MQDNYMILVLIKTTSFPGQDQAMVQQLQSMRQTEDRNSEFAPENRPWQKEIESSKPSIVRGFCCWFLGRVPSFLVWK